MSEIAVKIGIWVLVILVALVGLYLAYVVLLFFCLGIYAGGVYRLSGLRVRRRMRLAGRFLTCTKALERIEDQQGTLILESPTLGWRIARVWVDA
ncbi:MAG: hypothetical protein JSU63_12860 [Phycisphaerales bacterium]|nr:MAG: hypothetical protein JSU63_12860 [Phycisphaerales bacterium]